MLMVLGKCAGTYCEASKKYAKRYPNNNRPSSNPIKNLKLELRAAN